MAKNKKAKEAEGDDIEGAPKKKSKLFLIIIIVLFLLLAGGGYVGAAYFLQLPPFEPAGPTPEEIAAQKAEQEKERMLLQRDIYVKCGNKFVFNMKSGRRMHAGQVEVVLVVVGEDSEALAKKHLTLINSVIFEKLSTQSFESLLLPSGRQRLKRELLDTVRAKMSEIAKAPVVDQILFTDFVVQ